MVFLAVSLRIAIRIISNSRQKALLIANIRGITIPK